MSKDFLMVKQIDFVIVTRRIKTLGIAITAGIVMIYLAGLLIAGNNVKENFEIVNLGSLLLLMLIIPMSLFVKKLVMKKVNLNNFMSTYFTAHIIPFSIVDFGALFCITTNLFVNGNILYASIGIAISVGGMILNFPREEDFEKIKPGV